MVNFLDVVLPDNPAKSTWKDFFSNDFVIIIGLCVLVLLIVFVIFKLVKAKDAKSRKKK